MADLNMEISDIERKSNDAIVNIRLSEVEAGMSPQIKFLLLTLKDHAQKSDEQIQRVALSKMYDYIEKIPDEA